MFGEMFDRLKVMPDCTIRVITTLHLAASSFLTRHKDLLVTLTISKRANMSRATRRQKLEAKLSQIEGEFRELLLQALNRCASGEWGMFGQNDAVLQAHSPALYARLKSRSADKLLELGQQISDLRTTLGIQESFHLFARYLEYRDRRSSNALGEPKLAAQFLAELNPKSSTETR
jgi:hypothetical protein